MRGAGCADVLGVLQAPGNKADAVPCERLPTVYTKLTSQLTGDFIRYLLMLTIGIKKTTLQSSLGRERNTMQLTIRVPEEQMVKIALIAKELGLKKTDVTRMAINRFLSDYEGTEKKPYEKAKHLLGIAESGVSDLGRRHREYLVEKIKTSRK
jgi:hypothetical protein